MAFVEKAGSKYAVKQGNTGKVLCVLGTKKAADAKVDGLHAKNKPSRTNRGKSARKNQGKVAKRRKR